MARFKKKRMNPYRSLADFILDQMRIRDMGSNEFADFIGVGHSVISKHTRPDAPLPSLKLLRQLSKATGVPIDVLVGLVFPEDPKPTQVKPEAEALARFFMELPEGLANTLLGIARAMKKSGKSGKTS